MTENSLASIMPDSITGAIFALEGVKNCVVLLNGPMGCRFYHSTTSRFLSVRPLLTLPDGEGGERRPVDYNTLNEWFFRQERVPCTWLDGHDFVYGTLEKVREALTYIRDQVAFDLLAIVNAPGATLIGDNMLEPAKEILGDRRVILLESPGLSETWEAGHSTACLELLRHGAQLRSGARRAGRPTVNLLGVSLWQRYQEGDVQELRRLLDLCGIGVNAVLCADTGLEELERMPDADLDLVLYPELGLECARWLEREWGVPCWVCPTLPLGFKAVETVFRELCRRLGTSDAALLEESRRARALCWYKLRDMEQSYQKPRGVKFYVDVGETADRAYTSFLRDYLGMVPAAPGEAELVFSDANVISELMLTNRSFCGIEARMPGMGYVDLVPKTHLGIRGALFLIEQVLNGLMSRL